MDRGSTLFPKPALDRIADVRWRGGRSASPPHEFHDATRLKAAHESCASPLFSWQIYATIMRDKP
jgi:hypothetical protein